MATNTTNARFVNAIAKRDGWRCRYCGKPLVRWNDTETPLDNGATVDHIHPVIKGGTDSLENLVLCCKRCNSGKKHRGLFQFMTETFPDRLFERTIERLSQ